MKYIILAIISILACNSSLFAQYTIDNVLVEIEKNNTTLLALQKRAEADKLGNKTGIYLTNPEVEFNYLWGNPSELGNRTDFSIKQSFDFPTAYGHKKQIANIKNEQTDLEYRKLQKSLLLETRVICYNLIYHNALKFEFSKRLNHAESIANSYKAKFDAGETNILEYNKAQLNLLNLSKEMESLDIERNALLGELSRLNAGKRIEFTTSEFPTATVSTNFEQWYLQAEQSNPILNWLRKEIEITKKKVSLSKALSLPKLQVGYMSESIVGQDFKGFTVGLSIPIWENKNTVKYAKANTLALENLAIDNKVQLYNKLKVLHTKAVAFQYSSAEYKSKLQSFNNSKLLKKAFDIGEISLIDYIMELSIYYKGVNNLLEMERDMSTTIAELNQYL